MRYFSLDFSDSSGSGHLGISCLDPGIFVLFELLLPLLAAIDVERILRLRHGYHCRRCCVDVAGVWSVECGFRIFGGEVGGTADGRKVGCRVGVERDR